MDNLEDIIHPTAIIRLNRNTNLRTKSSQLISKKKPAAYAKNLRSRPRSSQVITVPHVHANIQKDDTTVNTYFLYTV